MTMVVLLPPLVAAVVGLLMYALCTSLKLQEIGRIVFFCGLLALLLASDAVVSVRR